MTVGGGAKLQLVFGDITNETTDIVVNTTNFADFHRGEFGISSVSFGIFECAKEDCLLQTYFFSVHK